MSVFKNTCVCVEVAYDHHKKKSFPRFKTTFTAGCVLPGGRVKRLVRLEFQGGSSSLSPIDLT